MSQSTTQPIPPAKAFFTRAEVDAISKKFSDALSGITSSAQGYLYGVPRAPEGTLKELQTINTVVRFVVAPSQKPSDKLTGADKYDLVWVKVVKKTTKGMSRYNGYPDVQSTTDAIRIKTKDAANIDAIVKERVELFTKASESVTKEIEAETARKNAEAERLKQENADSINTLQGITDDLTKMGLHATLDVPREYPADSSIRVKTPLGEIRIGGYGWRNRDNKTRFPVSLNLSSLLQSDTIIDLANAVASVHVPPSEAGAIGEEYWHIHHEKLHETLTEPLQNRIDYIENEKDEDEIETRLRLLKPVKTRPYPTTEADWETLHKTECPDCPWDGKTIFPEDEE